MRPFSPKSPIETGFSVRVAALYAAIFVGGGIQLPFFPVWLTAKGLDPTMVGLVLAAPMLVRVFAIPLATRSADRYDALRGTLIVTTALSVAGLVLVGMAEGGLAILVAFTLTSLAVTPIMPLMETYALRGLGARGRAYGPVRLWGSVAFVFGTFGAGYAIDVMPARHLIWLMVATTIAVLIAAVALVPLSVRGAQAGSIAPHKKLLRDPAFIAVVASAGLTQASHAVYYGFSALDWRHAGLDGTAIAALWGLGVLAEIVLFAVSARLPAFLTPSVLLILGGLGAALRWSVMALDPPVVLLPALQVLHGLSFGATHLGALFFITRHTPPGQAATAQGYFAIILGAVMAGAMGLSGWLYGVFGTGAYASMALAALAGCAYGAVANRAAHRLAGSAA